MYSSLRPVNDALRAVMLELLVIVIANNSSRFILGEAYFMFNKNRWSNILRIQYYFLHTNFFLLFTHRNVTHTRCSSTVFCIIELSNDLLVNTWQKKGVSNVIITTWVCRTECYVFLYFLKFTVYSVYSRSKYYIYIKTSKLEAEVCTIYVYALCLWVSKQVCLSCHNTCCDTEPRFWFYHPIRHHVRQAKSLTWLGVCVGRQWNYVPRQSLFLALQHKHEQMYSCWASLVPKTLIINLKLVIFTNLSTSFLRNRPTAIYLYVYQYRTLLSRSYALQKPHKNNR